LYLIRLLRNIFRLSNIGTLIFFLLNASLIIGVFSEGDPEMMKVIAVVYLISVAIALSPFGEGILGLMAGARRMTRADMRARVLPLITRVHNSALAEMPGMTRIINLKVMYDPAPNAFALGRHTICVTEGLLHLSDDQIEGILAHEMGHLALHHTDIQLWIGGGNFIITFFMLIMRIISAVALTVGSIFSLSGRRSDDSPTVFQGCGCGLTIIGALSYAFVWLWTKFCMLFLMWSSRANEYRADKFAADIGYGYGLASALDSIASAIPQNDFIRALYSSHPETHDRIGRLQELGVPYRTY